MWCSTGFYFRATHPYLDQLLTAGLSSMFHVLFFANNTTLFVSHCNLSVAMAKANSDLEKKTQMVSVKQIIFKYQNPILLYLLTVKK